VPGHLAVAADLEWSLLSTSFRPFRPCVSFLIYWASHICTK